MVNFDNLLDDANHYPRTPDDKIAEMRTEFAWSLMGDVERREADGSLVLIQSLRRVGHYSIMYANGKEVFIYPTMKHKDRIGMVQHPLSPCAVES